MGVEMCRCVQRWRCADVCGDGRVLCECVLCVGCVCVCGVVFVWGHLRTHQGYVADQLEGILEVVQLCCGCVQPKSMVCTLRKQQY